MSEVTLSSAIRSNLLNLQSTAALMGKTQERLATGLRVNSALDNPTNFFTASSLNSRASDLGALLDSVSNAVQTVAAADKGISAMTKLVESAQATARQALQTTTTTDSPVAATAGSITGGAFTALDFTVTAATAGTSTLAAADFTTSTFGVGDTITFDIAVDGAAATAVTISAANVAAVGNNDATIDDVQELADALNEAGTGLPVGVTAAVSGTDLVFTSATTGATSAVAISNVLANDISTDGTVTTAGLETATAVAGAAAGAAKTLAFGVAVDGGAATNVTINLAAVQAVGDNDGIIDTVAELASIVDAQLGAGVTVDGTGATLVLSSATTGATSDITISGTTATNVVNSSGVANGTDAGTAATTTPIPNAKRAELVTQYNDLLDQIDQLAADAGFNGVNLLNGDNLEVLFNEDGTSKLAITGVTYNAAGLSLTPLVSTAFDTNTSINTTLDALKTGIETLRVQASKFGSNLSVIETRQDFTKSMINVLETGAANLTLADSNEEAANLLALQTRQQLSSTALSLASQADQNVLRLF